jgi:hypothetical protein
LPETLRKLVNTVSDAELKVLFTGISFAFIVGVFLTKISGNLDAITEKQEQFAANQVDLQLQTARSLAKEAELEAAMGKQAAVSSEIHANINRTLESILRKLD